MKYNFIHNIVCYYNPKKIKFNGNFIIRAYVMGALCCLLLFFVLLRYAWISFFPTQIRTRVIDTGSKQFETTFTLFQQRSTITDRNGKPLAISVPSTSIFLLTKKIPKDPQTITVLAKQFHIPESEWIEYSKAKKNFLWFKRQLTFNEIEKLGNLKKWQDFIGTVDEPKRYYPEKDLASQLIGFVGQDGQGLEGVEKIYNSRLGLVQKKINVLRDARGHPVIVTPNAASKPDEEIPNLRLSIDLTIQEITQNALAKGVKETRAKGGSAIVMDVKTGEILSIASYPFYDLNNPPQNSPEARRFRPIMDAIELGSVVKPMWIAKALDMNLITTETKIFAENGKMSLPGGFIHDTHNHGFLTPREIIKLSSNIGAYKVVQKMGRENFYNAFMQIGFGREPGTGLPGEWGGRIQKPDKWSEMRFANMAFGQGFAISPLQLIHGLSIIVGGGIDHGVNILKRNTKVTDEVGPELRYVSENTSHIISEMLTSVVEDEGGTAPKARIPGVFVGGKTGTAQVWNNNLHSYSGRTPVFEGIFPANDPQLAIVVVLDEVAVRPAYGGPLSGPIFSEIGQATLNYLNSTGVLNLEYYPNSYLKRKESAVTYND